MAESYCEILLDCFRHCTPVDEVLRASCRMAYTVSQLIKRSKEQS